MNENERENKRTDEFRTGGLTQAELDAWWQAMLDEGAARNVRPHDYNPIRRFQQEMDDEIQRQDRAFRRQR
jgi:hypothetical protein